MTDPHAEIKTEQPPEQEEAKRIAEFYIEQGDLQFGWSDPKKLAREYKRLLAAYEDRSAAFERAAADCVRLEGALRQIYEHEASLVANCYGASKALRVSAAALRIPEAEDEQHARAEHLREAREVEQHQEEKHREDVGLICSAPYCGSLDWTVLHFGRVTHKHACPVRTDPFCQSHPNGCPPATPKPVVEEEK